MTDILALARANQKRAFSIIEETDIINIWKSVGARPNLVGSMRTGLLMDHRDIDFHIYSKDFTLADSFAAIAKLAENPRISRIEYANLLDTDEKCVEWHAWYRDDDETLWQIDMIHIIEGSHFDGYFENVADAIKAALTPETKLAILTIKHEIPKDEHVSSVAIYRAVIEGGVRTLKEFRTWAQQHETGGIIEWMP